MNFKESYKKANDEIKGDRALLDKILNTPVKEKTKITPFVYRFASCAAAIILVGAVILMPEIKEKFVSENENAVAEECAVEEAKYSILADTAEVTEETADGHISEKADTDGETLTENNSNSKNVAVNAPVEEFSENATFGRRKTETDDVAADVEIENGEISVYSADEDVELTEESQIADASEATATAEATKTKIASGGGGSAAATRNTTMAVDTKDAEKTASEIIGLIGISEGSLTPSGMVLVSADVEYAEYSEEGNITAYEINMVYEKDGAKLILRLADSVTPLALDVAENSGMVSASKTVRSTDVFITAYNFTHEEVESYLNGIN